MFIKKSTKKATWKLVPGPSLFLKSTQLKGI